MFDFSFAELLVVLLVSLLIFGPKDFINVIKNIQLWVEKIKSMFSQYLAYLNKSIDIDEQKQDIAEYVIDLEGNIRRTYSLNKIMPNLIIKENDKDKK